MNTNYLSPVMEVKLTSPAGRTLFVTDPPSSEKRSKLGVFVESVSAKLTMGMTSEISATFKAPREIIDRVLSDELEYFLPGGMITVRLGYARGPYTQEFTGIIQQPSASFDAAAISISITGKAGLWYSSRVDTVRTFENKTVLECLKAICLDHASEVYYLSPGLGEIPLTSPVALLLASQKIELLSVINETFRNRDWFTLKTLIEQRAKMRFYVSGQRIVLFSKTEQAVVDKAPRFVWMLPSDPSNGIYPMLSFSPENTEYPITVGLRELIARDVNPDDKTLFELIRSRASGDVDAPQTKQAGLPEQARPFASDKGAISQEASRNIVPVSARDASPTGRMVQAKNIGEEQGGIVASWQVLGNPNITPGRLCPVEGVTRLFSGNYFIREVDYTMGLDGFKCNVTGFTMGYSTNPYEFFQKASAEAGQPIGAEGDGVSRGGIGRQPR